MYSYGVMDCSRKNWWAGPDGGPFEDWIYTSLLFLLCKWTGQGPRRTEEKHAVLLAGFGPKL